MHLLAGGDADQYSLMSGTQFPGPDYRIDRGLQGLGYLRAASLDVLNNYAGFHNDNETESPFVLQAPDSIYHVSDFPWPLDSSLPVYIVLIVQTVSLPLQVNIPFILPSFLILIFF